MKTKLFAIVVAAALLPLGAQAKERVVDGALGTASGAVVFGPVGAVAGAVVGYTAGPAISCSWGLSKCRRYHHHRAKHRRRY